MTELINIITSKPNWSEKINNIEITTKWRGELIQQGINEKYLDLVIDLLKNYKTKEYKEDDTYEWVIDIHVNPNECSIVDDCKCKCKVCRAWNIDEISDDDETSDDDEISDDDEKIISRKKRNECECIKFELLKEKKRKFMLKFISIDYGSVNDKIKKNLKIYTAKLEKEKPIDYHPGTNDQVIDLVHPSLYCYVKGITKTTVPVNPKIMFQWLPAEISLINRKAIIKSYINNLDPIKNIDLYITIANIFEKFVPKFEYVLQTLYDNGRITTYKPLSKCQVIVKLANTVLTSKKPVFPKGSWHLEGLPYEKIIATGIYYYEMTNITNNYLKFRSTITDAYNIKYPQDNFKYVERHYGFQDAKRDNDSNCDTVIKLGKVETKEDMCLVFPNFMQHQVSKFKLVDKNKPGTRKILVFFLIDPSTRILSTADVPPQQETMTLADAKVFRELLMYQRKYEISDQNIFFERGWSLCEH